MEQKLNFEFRSFLLQLGKELKSQDLEHLKFILTPYVSSAECDKMSFCSYFEELKRRCHLSPTNFGVLKNGLNEIGREDLVGKIVLKELYFSEISNQIGAPNLGTNVSDIEFDGTANGRHSGKNSPDLQNELLQNEKLMERKKEKTKKTQADYLLIREEGLEVSHDGSIDLHSNEQLISDEAARDEITESNTTKEEVSDVEMKSAFKRSPKGTCDDKILYHKNLRRRENLRREESAAESKADGEKFEKKSPVDDNGPGARPKDKKVKTTRPSKTDQGKAMEVDEKVTGTNPYGELFFANESTKEYELVPPDTKSSKEPTESGYSNPSSPVGTVHEEGSGPDPFYSDNSDVTLDEEPKVPLSGSTHGTHVTMELTKEYPSVDGFSTPPSDIGIPMSPSGEKRPVIYDEEPHDPAPASMGRPKCHHPPGVFSTPPPSVYGGSMDYGLGFYGPGAPPLVHGGSMDGGFAFTGSSAPVHGGAMHSGLAFPGSSAHSQAELSEIIAALNPSAQQLSVEQQMAFLQKILAMQGNVSGTNPFPNPGQQSQNYMPDSQTDYSQKFGCYHKAGYSVVVTNGQLTESTYDKGMVMMESGTQFCIVVGNENDHAAEVDITFGGMYLGVWALEAKQSISHNPLVIEGSSGADGRLRFFSDVDDNKPKLSADFYGENPELNGLIELEFKPEVYLLRIFARHVRDQSKENLTPVSIAPSSTTTVGDLKQEISKKWDSRISCLLKGGKVLDEGKTISSYALTKHEVIQVVNSTEELKIESSGSDPITMSLDPLNVSLVAVKYFIEEKLKIPPHLQILRFKGQDVDIDGITLTWALLTSKKTPELKVIKDRNINIDILSHDGSEVKVDINWFATVQKLMDRLVERGICDRGAKLSLYENNKDISGVSNRKLFDLGLRNKSKIIVSKTAHSTHHGFSMSSLNGGSSQGFRMNLRGFDGLVKPTPACQSRRGFPDSAGTCAGDSCTNEAAYDCSQEDGEAGIAMLHGDKESVFKNFSLANFEQKFSKEKAVTLTIQLKAKRFMGNEFTHCAPVRVSQAQLTHGDSVAFISPRGFQPKDSRFCTDRILRITILADEWNSLKGGLSTFNRELAIHLARNPKVDVTFFVPHGVCGSKVKEAAEEKGVTIIEAKQFTACTSQEQLFFLQIDHPIDIIIGHGVKLGRQAEVIRHFRGCKWVHAVHTVPEQLGMFKDYPNAIAKNEDKNFSELQLCKKADLVLPVGPKLESFYSGHLRCDKKEQDVVKFTPGILEDLMDAEQSPNENDVFQVLLFGRGDDEDFSLKGYDIAAKAFTLDELKNDSFHLNFVGVPRDQQDNFAQKILQYGIRKTQLSVGRYIEDRKRLKELLVNVDLVIMPSRTEGFGFTALEALSAGVPILVGKNSGFAKALSDVEFGDLCVVGSDNPKDWSDAITKVSKKKRGKRLKEMQSLRKSYEQTYSWKRECETLVDKMWSKVNE